MSSSSRRVALTGASGFVGRHVVARLLSEGYELGALKKPDEPESTLTGIGIHEVVEGDLREPESIRHAIRKLTPDAVVHLGAKIKGTPEEYRVVNVEGTRAIVGACVEYGVQRFIFISSDAVLYNVPHGYGESKRLAEEIVRRSSLLWTILRPSWIYGVGDKRNFATLMAIIQKYPLIPVVPCLLQPIYVGDVVQAISGALVSAAAKKTYMLPGGSTLSFTDVVKQVCRALRVTRIICPVPGTILLPLLRICERFVPNPPIGSHQIEVWLKHQIQSSAEAQADLGVRPTSFAEGLRHTLVGGLGWC